MILYNFIKFTIGTFIKKCWLGKIQGLENVPKEGSVIICANHQSYLDFLLLGSIMKRRPYFLAAEVFFKSPLWIPLVKFTGQIRVDRQAKDKSNVYREVNKLFERDKILALFPEGTRSRTGEIQKGYNGAVKLAYENSVPILPVGIIGSFGVWPPHRIFPKRGKVGIIFGKPYSIHSEDYGMETKNLMNKIAQLSKKTYNY